MSHLTIKYTCSSMFHFAFLVLLSVTAKTNSVSGFESNQADSHSNTHRKTQNGILRPDLSVPSSSNFTSTYGRAATEDGTIIIQAKDRPVNSSSHLFGGDGIVSVRRRKLEFDSVLIKGNVTIRSANHTFGLGFFTTAMDGEANWYLGIWYTTVPTPTYVWVANREKPLKNQNQSSLKIMENGRLAVLDPENSVVWMTTNTEAATKMDLLENGNLVLLNSEGNIIWQSFDHPTDTLLPGMNLTVDKYLVSWRNSYDPSPGLYSLRLKPPQYGEFELVFNDSETYWKTGTWTGEEFSNVPEMTIPYIYRFYFDDPFTPLASFGFTEKALDNGLSPPLTKFRLESSGQLQQYTWSEQIQNWDKFWVRPETKCAIYGFCGNFGVCNNVTSNSCDCVVGYTPVYDRMWEAGEYSNGCWRDGNETCDENDEFEELVDVTFEGATKVSFPATRGACEKSCLGACPCIGFYFNERDKQCSRISGSLLNLRNSTAEGLRGDVFYIRVKRAGPLKKSLNRVVLTATIIASITALGIVVVTLFIVLKHRRIKKKVAENSVFSAMNVRVFSYKDLQLATRGFSEKIGHGGFGTVFQGELLDSSVVAVKRLERPGGGEKEFRAEVCTIGNVQHINLVRLRGFCAENSHRLLVYEFMPNGALSAYLRQDGLSLSWDVRSRIAIGTAKGIAYLHDGCRDCIIHCDIKPENILLDTDFTAKVSDFGLAKLIGRDFSRVLATMRGTWGYVAPEWISGVPITTKADVYSYGMTLLELIGGRRNVEGPPSVSGADNSGGGEKWFFPPWAAQQIIEQNVAAVIDSRLGNAYNIEEAKRLAMVAVWCIQDDDAMRPTMNMVVKMLEGVVEVSIPPPPKLLRALVSGDSAVKVDSGSEASGRVSFLGSNGNVEVSSNGSQ